MPLKHTTETVLVFLLAAAMLLTGAVLHFLPELPGGLFWWSLAFVGALLYPLVLYPLLRRSRAEYALRALHFLPAGLLLLWLVGKLGGEWIWGVGLLGVLLAWGLGLLPVALGMALLAIYCLNVIRQRGTRLPLLLILFVPFALLGLSSEWQGWTAGGGMQAATTQSSSSSVKTVANTSPSDHPGENQWRGVLRRMERREQRLLQREDPFADSSAIALQSSSAPVMIAVSTSSKTSALSALSASGAQRSASSISSARTVVQAPPDLVSSGPITNVLAVLLLAGYCAVLQARAIRNKNLA